MEDRTHRSLSDEEINRITGVYHNWRGDGDSAYQNETGFCQAASLEEIRAQNYVLTPGRYVTQEAQAVDTEPFEQKLERLTKDLESHFTESARLEGLIRENLKLLQPNKARV